MLSKISKSAALSLPLTGMKCLYKTARGKKLVCEIDVSALRALNEPTTIDEMVAEARLEYVAGKTDAFTDMKKLMAFLAK